MTEEQATEMIRLLKGIDWKLWEMYNMMKDVLVDENAIEQDDNDNN